MKINNAIIIFLFFVSNASAEVRYNSKDDIYYHDPYDPEINAKLYNRIMQGVIGNFRKLKKVVDLTFKDRAYGNPKREQNARRAHLHINHYPTSMALLKDMCALNYNLEKIAEDNKNI